VRLNIQILNAFRHAVEMAFDLLIINSFEKRKFEVLLNKINKLKKDFFSNDLDKNLLILNKINREIIKSSINLVASIDKYLKDNYWRVLGNSKILGIYKESGYVYIKNYDKYPVAEIMFSLYNKLSGWISILPESFLYPVIKYGQSKGVISKIIENNLVLYSNKFLTFKNIEGSLIERAEILNNHYEFYKNKINISPVHDYYQMSGKKITNREIKKICKII
jgi:hypothetical protein